MQQSNTNKSTQIGKIQPQAIDLEAAILGAVLIEKSAVTLAISKINNPEIFYNEKHKKIYEAIHLLWSRGEPIDILTVINQLRESKELENIGGAVYVVELTNKVNSSANIEFHIRIITEAWIKRTLITEASKIIEQGFDECTDCFEILDNAQSCLLKISESSQIIETAEGDKILADVIYNMEKAMKGGTSEAITTGFKGIDELTNGGSGKQELIIIGARPSMGKTAFVLALGLNAINDKNINVGVFSLEMSKEKLIGRLLSMESKVDSKKIKKGTINQEEQLRISNVLKNNRFKNFKIDDTAGITIGNLRSKAINMKSKWGIEMLIIDYLQLIQGTGKKTIREQEIAEISRTLKLIAKELNIPVIALSQLSRNLESRQDKRPMMSDLRESGSIEQDADVIAFIYRDEYYGVMQDATGESTKDIAEILIEKNREGDTGFVRVGFKSEHVLFYDLDKPKTYDEPLPEKQDFRFSKTTGEVFDSPF